MSIALCEAAWLGYDVREKGLAAQAELKLSGAQLRLTPTVPLLGPSTSPLAFTFTLHPDPAPSHAAPVRAQNGRRFDCRPPRLLS